MEPRKIIIKEEGYEKEKGRTKKEEKGKKKREEMLEKKITNVNSWNFAILAKFGGV